MYDIITFGSATQDIHIKASALKTVKDDKNLEGDFMPSKDVCMPLGSKINVEEIVFSTGGGGTNTAATFAKQGFRTCFCGAIGPDVSGLEILRELKRYRIETRFILKKKEKHTNQSIIISGENGETTILAYRGASDLLEVDDIPFKKIKKTHWIYVAPLSGLLCDNFDKLVDFAKENNIKVAINPSKQQLSLPAEKLANVFKKIDVLFLNQEEASFLTKIPFEEEQRIFENIKKMCAGVVVMTKGAKGVVVSDGKETYSAVPDPDRKVIDTTGAGDSFASGFLSDYIRSKGNIEKAIQLGLANSAGNLSKVGAKTGILDKKYKFKKIQVIKI